MTRWTLDTRGCTSIPRFHTNNSEAVNSHKIGLGCVRLTYVSCGSASKPRGRRLVVVPWPMVQLIQMVVSPTSVTHTMPSGNSFASVMGGIAKPVESPAKNMPAG